MIIVTMTGLAGSDAEIKDVGSSQLATVNLASSSKEKGEKVTTWVTCSFWGKQAETAAAYILKGTQVTVSGTAKLRTFDGKNGPKTVLEVNVRDFDLGSKGAGGGGGGEKESSSKQTSYMDEDDIPPF